VTRTHLSLMAWALTERGFKRIRSLIALSDFVMKNAPPDLQVTGSDVLRAAVVLLHALMEEFVRHVAGDSLPHASADVLNGVPLVGTSRSGGKFALGALARHRGKQVDSLLAESVREHLAGKAFGSLGAILDMLRLSGIPIDKLRIRRAALQGLIKRRHQIVHEGDAWPQTWRGGEKLRAISRRQTTRWLDGVERFVGEVDRHWHLAK